MPKMSRIFSGSQDTFDILRFQIQCVEIHLANNNAEKGGGTPPCQITPKWSDRDVITGGAIISFSNYIQQF